MNEEINKKDLAEEYIKKIEEFIEILQSKTVVFDFDGTLTNLKYAEDKILPCNNDDLYEYSKNNNLYEKVNFVKTMQYVMSKLNMEDVYVLTVTVETLRSKKEEAIQKGFSGIYKENIIHTNNPEEKIEVLKNIYSKNKKQIIFVEDNAEILIKSEKVLDFVEGYHISRLLS